MTVRKAECDLSFKNPRAVGKSRAVMRRPVALLTLTSILDQMRRWVQNKVGSKRGDPEKMFGRKLPKSESEVNI